MELGILLLVTAFTLSGAASMKIQAYFNSTACLPCPHSKVQNMSLSELVVFWQDQKKLVLYEHYLGREKSNSVNAKYLGRTSFDEHNWALRLPNVQITDMGSYDCYIQQKRPTGSVILQQTNMELSVVANFSEPEIELAQNVTRNSGINLTCTSEHGFPKPMKMYFLIINSTNKQGDDMEISQDNVTELFSVSTSLSLPFPEDAYNVTFWCVLETKSMNISSRPFSVVLPEPRPVQENWRVTVVVAVVVAVLGAVLPLIIYFLCSCWSRRKDARRSRSRVASVS